MNVKNPAQAELERGTPRDSVINNVYPLSLQPLTSCVSFNKQQRLACKQRFLPGWIAKKRKFTCGSIQNGSQNTSPSSWTVTDGGHVAVICLAWQGTVLVWHPCAQRSKPLRGWESRR